MKRVYTKPDVSDIKINGSVLCVSDPQTPFDDWNNGSIGDDRWNDLGTL